MAAYEILLLNTAVPQIQAAQAGDTYVVPRDIAVNANMTVTGNVGVGTTGTTFKSLFNTAVSNAGDIQLRRGGFIGFSNAADNGNSEYIFANAGNLEFGIAGSTALNLNSSGNLGLGVTPSAWNSSYKAFQSQAGAIASVGAGEATYLHNAFIAASGNYTYVNTAAAARYSQAGGVHYWFTAPSGTAGNAISFTQAMTLDANGNLLVGATSRQTNESMRIGANGIQNSLLIGNSSQNNGAFVGAFNDTALFSVNRNPSTGSFVNTSNYAAEVLAVGSSTTSYIAFGTTTAANTAPTERARITSGGYFKASDNGTYFGSTGSYHEFSNSANDSVVIARSTNAGSSTIVYQSELPASATGNHIFARTNSSTVFQVAANGNVTNTNGSYGTISDQKLKQDIVDAGSQWGDLKAIRFRKYRMKTDVAANPDAPYLLGVVAQELEQVSPGLVDEHPDADGEVTKTVKSSILLMKAAVALQEAMARIETLEAEVAALKGN